VLAPTSKTCAEYLQVNTTISPKYHQKVKFHQKA